MITGDIIFASTLPFVAEPLSHMIWNQNAWFEFDFATCCDFKQVF